MRRRILAALMLGTLAVAPAIAFKQGSRSSDRNHQAITAAALEAVAVNRFAVGFSAAISDLIQESNAKTDWDPDNQFSDSHFTDGEYHFDGESFAESAALIARHRTQILEHLRSNRITDAQKLMGVALHTIQDFYAHSSWVDKHQLDLDYPHPNWGAADPFEDRRLQQPHAPGDSASPVCRDLVLLPDAALTTGYFVNLGIAPELSTPKGRCPHGGDTSDALGLNKDQHERPLHLEARRAAREGSQAFVQGILNEITDASSGPLSNNIICAFLGQAHLSDCGRVVVTTVAISERNLNAGLAFTVRIDGTYSSVRRLTVDIGADGSCIALDGPTSTKLEARCVAYSKGVYLVRVRDGLGNTLASKEIQIAESNALASSLFTYVGATVRLWAEGLYDTVSAVVWSIQDYAAALVAKVVNGTAEAVSANFTSPGQKNVLVDYKDSVGNPLGGSSMTVEVRAMPRITSVTTSPSNLTAGQPISFTVAGNNLHLGLSFSLDGCANVHELPTADHRVRLNFSCTFPVGTAPGPRDGMIATTGNPFAGTDAVLHRFLVQVDPTEPVDPGLGTVALLDAFSGGVIDATMWTIDGWDATGNDYTGGLGRGIGPVTIGNGVVEFGRLGRISTKNKVTFSGNGGIVIEGRMAGPGPLHDTTVMLVDSTGGDQILMGDTNYAGFGFYALGVGSYKLKETSAISDPSNPLALGSTTTAFMEYRLTIIGDKIKIERGPTLANITQTGTGTLGRSIAGRQFHISIGATWAYYPGTWDWIRVKADSATSTGTGKIPHSGVAGSQCYTAGSNALVACDAPGALALNSQQDGHRAGVDAMSYSPVGAYSKEECVKDDVTGLIWEGKTSSGPRAGTRRFANQGTVGTNDADGYVQEVNNARLCGFSDWRLPTVIELQGLVNYGVPSPGPTISTSWFPNTTGAVYWTADGSAERSTEAWYVNFDYGSASWSPRVLLYAVRLVRGDAQPPRYTFNSTGDEVTDTRTGLVWRRCVEGMAWNGSTCTGGSRIFTHEGALAHAQSQAGWRLPSVKELSSIADRSRMTPALNTAVFPAISAGYFWTTTPLVGGPSDAWHVRAETGAVFNTGARSTGNLQVRLVRTPLIAGNGRRYEVIECGTWTQCRSAARAKGGELATVRSQSENDWLVANVLPAAKTEYGLWIGLNDEAQPGVFKWTSGEPVTFTNWRVDEPNNLWIDGGAETYVHMWRGNSNPTFLPGVWNDIIDQPIVPIGGSTSIITQAIVEYAQ